jgi:tRNA threonylcarbamoyladenosine biosynthesis protein TsaB
MKVLALDTSNRELTVAILDDQKILATETTTVHQKHAEYLLPIIDELVRKVDLTPNDLERVVVATGPGSYTGIRIATATAKTLAYTLQLDLVCVSSLQTLALNVKAEGSLVMPMFDARNNNVFTGLYRIENQLPVNVIADCHTDFDKWLSKVDAEDTVIYAVGSGSLTFKSSLQDKFGDCIRFTDEFDNLPQAARLGLYGEVKEPVKNIHTVVPNYLRLTKAEADWKQKHPGEEDTSYVEKIN